MIEINNLTTEKIDEDFVRKVSDLVLIKEGIDGKKEMSIAFVSQERMQELNKKYRGKDATTDVLSFPDTEIIICPKELQTNSKRFGVSFEQELARIVIHGILHLLGYNHNQMQEHEVYYSRSIRYRDNRD